MDIYAEIEDIKLALREKGLHKEVMVIDDAILSGSTSSEIYILLRGALKDIIRRKVSDFEMRERISKLVVEIERLI